MKILEVDIDLIDEDNNQPRYNFDDESLFELANSIKEVGLLNPIKVRLENNGRYKIVFGNRRYRAFKLLGLKTIPAIISEDQSDLDIYLEQLTENIQRESFNPVEEAVAFNKLLNDPKYKISKKYLASRLGKSERYISQKLDLLKFGKKVQLMIKSGSEIVQNQLTEEQVLPLKNVAVEYRDALAEKVAKEQASVNDVKKISELFLAEDISPQTKEFLITKSIPQLLNDWYDYQKSKNEDSKKVKIEIVDLENQIITEYAQGETSDKGYYNIPIVKKLYELLNSIPSQHNIPDSMRNSVYNIRIENKQEFINTVDSLIDCLLGHVEQWKKIKEIVSSNRLTLIKKDNKQKK